MEIRTIGIDLGKTVFHLIGVNARGEVVVRKKCSRTQLLRFTSNLRKCLIGMEACGGSHFLGRALREQGHDVRLMPAQYVKPYVKTNKNDYIDAEAIAEAVTRPTMRFVPIKTDDQLDLQSLHRIRERWVGGRTAVINQISLTHANPYPGSNPEMMNISMRAWRGSAKSSGRSRRKRSPGLKQPPIGCDGFRGRERKVGRAPIESESLNEV
jgi:Transposase